MGNFCLPKSVTNVMVGQKNGKFTVIFHFYQPWRFLFLMSLFVIFIQKCHGWCLWRKLIKKKFMFVKSDFMQNYDIKKIYFSSTFSNKNVMVDGWWKKKMKNDLIKKCSFSFKENFWDSIFVTNINYDILNKNDQPWH